MAELVVDMGSDGRSLTAALGDTVVVRLDEIPTSGYRWQVADVDPAVLEGMGDDFIPFAVAGLGGGGQHEFRFLVVGGGQSPLRLVHRRPWEPETAAVEELAATIDAIDRP